MEAGVTKKFAVAVVVDKDTLFFAMNGRGFTLDPRKATRFTEEQAKDIASIDERSKVVRL